MIKVLFVCWGNICRSPGEACKIKDFGDRGVFLHLDYTFCPDILLKEGITKAKLQIK